MLKKRERKSEHVLFPNIKIIKMLWMLQFDNNKQIKDVGALFFFLKMKWETELQNKHFVFHRFVCSSWELLS